MGHHHPTPPPPPPLTFRGSECAYMVQIYALSTPECPEGVPSHSRWTARGRTWGSPPSSRRTLKKKVLRVSSKREDMNESKNPMSQRNVLKEASLTSSQHQSEIETFVLTQHLQTCQCVNRHLQFVRRFLYWHCSIVPTFSKSFFSPESKVILLLEQFFTGLHHS